ncbi:MAG TPA: hypothetical protein VMS17_08220 [Gemmataceae bacterium]|nr:hypothetical protein [Gemmataceae bacterium]
MEIDDQSEVKLSGPLQGQDIRRLWVDVSASPEDFRTKVPSGGLPHAGRQAVQLLLWTFDPLYAPLKEPAAHDNALLQVCG